MMDEGMMLLLKRKENAHEHDERRPAMRRCTLPAEAVPYFPQCTGERYDPQYF